MTNFNKRLPMMRITLRQITRVEGSITVRRRRDRQPSETGHALIPYQVLEETYDYYEVWNYVNDINQDYTQVLTEYDEKGRIRESYAYESLAAVPTMVLVNQALNNRGELSALNLYTIDVNTGLPKKMCKNCVYTFDGRVNSVITK